MLDKMETMSFQDRTKLLAKKLKIQRGQNSQISGVIKNREGVHSKSESEFLQNWVEFYSWLYKNPLSSENPNKCSNLDLRTFKNHSLSHKLNNPIEFTEFNDILNKLPRGKAPGEDGFLLEELLCLDPPARQTLHKIIQIFYAEFFDYTMRI